MLLRTRRGSVCRADALSAPPQVCQLEHQLFDGFFPGADPDGGALAALMDPLCTVLYDALRPAFIQLAALESLCELVDILQHEARSLPCVVAVRACVQRVAMLVVTYVASRAHTPGLLEPNGEPSICVWGRCWRSSWGGAATRWRRCARCCCARWPTCSSASPSACRPSSRRAHPPQHLDLHTVAYPRAVMDGAAAHAGWCACRLL